MHAAAKWQDAGRLRPKSAEVVNGTCVPGPLAALTALVYGARNGSRVHTTKYVQVTAAHGTHTKILVNNTSSLADPTRSTTHVHTKIRTVLPQAGRLRSLCLKFACLLSLVSLLPCIYTATCHASCSVTTPPPRAFATLTS